MSRRHEQTLRFSTYSLLFVMLVAVQAVSAKTCDELQCLNSNPCQSFIAPDNTTHSRCICSGRWAGPRCEHVIRLEPELVTSTDVQLKISVVTSPSYDVTMASQPGGSSSSSSSSSSALSLMFSEAKEAQAGLNYTLVYWKRNDTVTALTSDTFLTSGEISCVLLQRRSTRQPALLGLAPRTRYTICVENGFLDSCVLSSFADAPALVPFPISPQLTALQPSLLASASASLAASWPSNCVTVFTLTPSASAGSASASGFVISGTATVRAVAAVSVVILILLTIVFVVFLARRKSVAVRVFVDTLFCGWRWCCCCCVSSSASSSSSSGGGDGGGGGGGGRSNANGSACNNNTKPSSSSSVDSGSTRLSHSQSFIRSASFIDEEDSRSSSQNRTLKRRVLDRLRIRKKKKKQRSSSYKTANMLLPPPASSSALLPDPRHQQGREGEEERGGHDELSPLDPDLSEDSVFENSSGHPAGVGGAVAGASAGVGAGSAHRNPLPAIHKARSKPHHRLSRKGRSYVAYSTKKDKNIKLTTVLESPHDDNPYGGSGIGLDVDSDGDDVTSHEYGEAEDEFNTI